jgi:hypothetical protein
MNPDSDAACHGIIDMKKEERRRKGRKEEGSW